MFRSTVVAAVGCAALASSLDAQAAPDTSRRVVPLAAVSVTATRAPRTTFDTPQPITVIDSADLRARLAHGIADVFRDIAGLDGSGVGPNQRRPEIRLQRGQRILLLEDGLRLNNTRRQQDFGELPALAGIAGTRSVEVVRGPSSVLYGTDAIGGVVNIISAEVPRSYESGELHGHLMYRYGDAGAASTPSGEVTGRFGRFRFGTNGSYREAESYRAPSGSFGNITLPADERVIDSGIRDRSYEGSLAFDLTATSELFARAESYRADQAGFGFIDPARLGANQPRVQILYPDQKYSRVSAGYRANALSLFFANRAEVTAYTQSNVRHLNNFIFVPISPTANVDSRSWNFTDMTTVGGRVELAKAFGAHVLTYGVDAFEDRSENSDSSVTVTTGFGPTTTRRSNVPSVPNATYRSLGGFTQLELRPVERLVTVFGGRLQNIRAETKETPNFTGALARDNRSTGVWTANALYHITTDLNAITSVGRGFRSPNLVERFFEGAAVEGNGFQRANAALDAEKSLNVDLGLRYRRGALYGEAFVFRNDISNAIRAIATGNTVNGRPEFQNQNIGKIRVDGLETTLGARFTNGIATSASLTRFDGKNVSEPTRPIGDSYASKVVGDLGYTDPRERFSAGYTVRHQGKQSDVIIGANPIGSVIPAFTVHGARASAKLFSARGITNTLAFTMENIGNTLYAEFPNASFFRPEPGRSVNVALIAAF